MCLLGTTLEAWWSSGWWSRGWPGVMSGVLCGAMVSATVVNWGNSVCKAIVHEQLEQQQWVSPVHWMVH